MYYFWRNVLCRVLAGSGWIWPPLCYLTPMSYLAQKIFTQDQISIGYSCRTRRKASPSPSLPPLFLSLDVPPSQFCTPCLAYCPDVPPPSTDLLSWHSTPLSTNPPLSTPIQSLLMFTPLEGGWCSMLHSLSQSSPSCLKNEKMLYLPHAKNKFMIAFRSFPRMRGKDWWEVCENSPVHFDC